MSLPHLIIIAKPPVPVVNSLETIVQFHGVDQQLGRAMSTSGNWHQTLSSRYDDEPRYQERMLRAGANVKATQIVLTLDRITGPARPTDIDIHYEFRGPRNVKSLSVLLSAVQSALYAEGIGDGKGHSPHITISYFAPAPIETIYFAPIVWLITEILLVRTGGKPFHYEELGRWPLAPAKQLDLFS